MIKPRQLTIWMLAFISATLPSYVIRYRLGPVPTSVLENLILLTAAAYAWTLWSERRLPAARTWLDIPIVLLLLSGIVGVVVAPDHTRALGIYRAYFVEAIAIYYIAVDVVRTKDDLRRVLLIAAIGSSAFAIGQIGRFGMAEVQHSIEIDNGPAFLNTSANAVAMFLEPPLAFAAGLALFGSSSREKLVAVLTLGLVLIAIVLTLSRASYLAMALLAVVVVVSIPRPRWRLAAVAVLGVAAVVAAQLPIINQRLGSFAHSVQLRWSIYGQALRMLSQRPITGAGISGFPIRVAPFRPGSQEVELYPHNLWLTTWSELGIIGLLAFAAIFFGLLWQGWRALRSAEGTYRAVIWGATGALLLYLVHGMFDSPYWKNDLSVEFWLLAALMVIGVRGARAQSLAGGAEVQSRSSSD